MEETLDRSDDGLAERVERAQAGNASAIRALWTENRPWVAAVVLAAKDRADELEDLLQEVALRMVRGISELDEPRAFRGWLRQVALNVARAEGRKKTRRRELIRLAPMAPDAAAADTRSDVMELVSKLPESHRELLMLRGVRGMSYKQIATVTGLPETTIETRIARGRRMLREMAEVCDAG